MAFLKEMKDSASHSVIQTLENHPEFQQERTSVRSVNDSPVIAVDWRACQQEEKLIMKF